MSKQHLAMGRNGIDKIIRNAGYKFCKAKVYLTSNDPDYKHKVQKIINILAHLNSSFALFASTIHALIALTAGRFFADGAKAPKFRRLVFASRRQAGTRKKLL